MTFDEAVREYQLRSSIGPLVQGVQLSPFVNVPQQEYDQVKFLNNLFYEIINKLRKEYAPTIEMTQEQYDVLGELDIDIIKQVLLHPETIKIVDE